MRSSDSIRKGIEGFFNAVASFVRWIYGNILWAVAVILLLDAIVFAATKWGIFLALLNGFVLVLFIFRIWKAKKARGQ